MNENPSIVSHVSLGTNDFEASISFYDRVMPTIGAKRIMEHPGAVAYGKTFPEFWVQKPINEKPAETANGIHFGFMAQSQDAVRAFHEAALKAGGTCDGKPGPREIYGPQYYGCFVIDPNGHKIEAMHWDESAS